MTEFFPNKSIPQNVPFRESFLTLPSCAKLLDYHNKNEVISIKTNYLI